MNLNIYHVTYYCIQEKHTQNWGRLFLKILWPSTYPKNWNLGRKLRIWELFYRCVYTVYIITIIFNYIHHRLSMDWRYSRYHTIRFVRSFLGLVTSHCYLYYEEKLYSQAWFQMISNMINLWNIIYFEKYFYSPQVTNRVESNHICTF